MGHMLARQITLSLEEWVTDTRTQSVSQAGGWIHIPKLLGTANLGRKVGITKRKAAGSGLLKISCLSQDRMKLGAEVDSTWPHC